MLILLLVRPVGLCVDFSRRTHVTQPEEVLACEVNFNDHRRQWSLPKSSLGDREKTSFLPLPRKKKNLPRNLSEGDFFSFPPCGIKILLAMGKGREGGERGSLGQEVRLIGLETPLFFPGRSPSKQAKNSDPAIRCLDTRVSQSLVGGGRGHSCRPSDTFTALTRSVFLFKRLRTTPTFTHVKNGEYFPFFSPFFRRPKLINEAPLQLGDLIRPTLQKAPTEEKGGRTFFFSEKNERNAGNGRGRRKEIKRENVNFFPTFAQKGGGRGPLLVRVYAQKRQKKVSGIYGKMNGTWKGEKRKGAK